MLNLPRKYFQYIKREVVRENTCTSLEYPVLQVRPHGAFGAIATARSETRSTFTPSCSSRKLPSPTWKRTRRSRSLSWFCSSRTYEPEDAEDGGLILLLDLPGRAFQNGEDARQFFGHFLIVHPRSSFQESTTPIAVDRRCSCNGETSRFAVQNLF